MDFILEIILELYLGLVEILIPERKLKKWQSMILKILSVVISTGILACIAIGIDILVKNGKTVAGIACTAVGCTLFAVQTVIFVIVLIHEIKEEKLREKSNIQANDNEQSCNK